MQNFVRVDGTPKIEKERPRYESFVSARSWPGLLGDAVPACPGVAMTGNAGL